MSLALTYYRRMLPAVYSPRLITMAGAVVLAVITPAIV